jgi:hypothetical protein
MSWTEYVSGGVGPPTIAVYNAGGQRILCVELPATAALAESFETVNIRHTNLAGSFVDIPRGFRYRARVHLPYVDAATWRALATAFASWRAGCRLTFQPHADCANISYEVVPAGDFAFPYLAGKYLGYAGSLELAGAELLAAIPMTWEWNYFCAADEGSYAAGEISYFAAAAEEDYAPAEPAFFCPAAAAG